jgi:hypothetical protein
MEKHNTHFKELLFFALILLFLVFSCNRNKNAEQQPDYENDNVTEESISVSGNDRSEKLDVNNVREQYDDEGDFIAAVLKNDWEEPYAVEINGYTGDKEIIRIPPQINSLPVRSIGKEAFSNRELVKVIIPDSVYSIEESAFENSNLIDVTFGSRVSRIANRAFAGNRLTSIIIPDSVTYIGNSSFEENQLTSVTLNDSISELSEGIFLNNKLDVITIPEVVANIKSMAFAENQITTIIVTSRFSVSNNSFANDFSVFFNSSGKKPGTYTWDGTSWNVVFSESIDPKDFEIELQEIGPWNYYERTVAVSGFISGYKGGDHTVIDIPPKIGGLPVVGINVRAFVSYQRTSTIIPSIIIPDSVIFIATGAFQYSRLTSVTLGNNVQSIGYGAFSYCGLTSVDIPNSVTYIGTEAFCQNELTSIVIPDSVTYIGKMAFASNKLTSVIIGNYVTTIDAKAFLWNTTIVSITIPYNVDLVRDGRVGVFNFEFDDFYDANGKKAGTYIWDGNVWSKVLDGTN